MSGQLDYPDNYRGDSVDSRNISAGRGIPSGTLVHTTSGLSSLHWLLTGSARAGYPASADTLIDRRGERYNLVPDGYYPYHAGVSRLTYNNRLYQGNEVSALLLGVELENLDTTYCTWQQLDSLAELIVHRGLVYGWRWPYYILGHYEVALPVGRRSDPLGFAWGDFMGRLYVRARDAAVAGLGSV
jgi:N-acetyl-anhydromuramyl-L-alanine amidase AmpD